MTPKERVIASIKHREPDRVPTGEWQFGRELLKPVLGREPLFLNGMATSRAFWEGRRKEVIEDWKNGLVEAALKLGWDALLVHLVIDENARVDIPEEISENLWKYPNGAVIRYSEETNRFFTVEGGSLPEAGESPAPEYGDSRYEVIRHVVKELGGTHFIFSSALNGPGKPSLKAPAGPVKNEVENWVDLYQAPDEWLEKKMAGLESASAADGIRAARREGMDGVAYSCDYGSTKAPFLSPEMFRKYVLPFLSAYVAMVHDEGLVCLLHSCGNNRALMDYIVESGVDVYQSIQPEMDIVDLKKRYGKNIALWGGVPAGSLITSSPEEVYRESEKYLDACKPGGGYIFGTSHSVMPGARYENYAAMLKALEDFGSYRGGGEKG